MKWATRDRYERKYCGSCCFMVLWFHEPWSMNQHKLFCFMNNFVVHILRKLIEEAFKRPWWGDGSGLGRHFLPQPPCLWSVSHGVNQLLGLKLTSGSSWMAWKGKLNEEVYLHVSPGCLPFGISFSRSPAELLKNSTRSKFKLPPSQNQLPKLPCSSGS